jgi:hypothetical protein
MSTYRKRHVPLVPRPNYRIWFIGALVSNTGAWMQATALSWVVLTQLTHNDAAMGLTMALQFGPPAAARAAHGPGRRQVRPPEAARPDQTLLMGLGIAIGILLLVDAMTLLLMYTSPSRSASSPRSTIPRVRRSSPTSWRENATNAVALNAASFNGARMIGPAAAGLVIVAVGTGWVFLINAPPSSR